MTKLERSMWRQAVWSARVLTVIGERWPDDYYVFLALWYGALIDEGKN